LLAGKEGLGARYWRWGILSRSRSTAAIRDLRPSAAQPERAQKSVPVDDELL